MSKTFVVKYSNLPDSFRYAPYFVVLSSSEEKLINGIYSAYGKPLVMWECDNQTDARYWAEYLRSRV